MSWLWWVQIAADVVLVAAVGLLLWRLKGLGELPRAATPKDLEQFISESQRLSGEFDRLLGEKRELVNSTLAGLDARISQLRGLAEELEGRVAQARSAAPAPPAQAAPPAAAPAGPRAEEALAGFRQKVLALAKEGKAPAQIARATGRPRGEVELVLGLSGREPGGGGGR
jgi:nucleoid-associated protein YgaU